MVKAKSEKRKQRKSDQSSAEKDAKRPRTSSLEITHVRPAKQNCTAKHSSIVIPLNDAIRYRQAVDRLDIYPVPPSSYVQIHFAIRNNLQKRLIYGLKWNEVIERIEIDEETGIPWQVPKVTAEFKSIDYNSMQQRYTASSRDNEGKAVSPIALPQADEMTAVEYRQAVEENDPRLSPTEERLFEFIRTSSAIIQQGIFYHLESSQPEASKQKEQFEADARPKTD